MEQKAITYLLDENYYPLIDKLAIDTENQINQTLKDITSHYMEYLAANSIEQPKTSSEYSLELLYIGVLYESYVKEKAGSYTVQLEGLYEELTATKEFDEIVARFKLWLSYWRLSDRLKHDFPIVMELVSSFLAKCEKALGQYTLRIPEFLKNAEQVYEGRADYRFITRSINEYYINMVGAQILNHVYQEEFQSVDQIYIFVPGCMAAQSDQCKAIIGNMGYTCTRCTSSCPINLTQQEGEKHHAKTVIVYHSSELYHTRVPSSEIKYGVIGIACVLNLISGGLKARELGYIPQCILLDYCGCKQHWSPAGIVTDINRSRLAELFI